MKIKGYKSLYFTQQSELFHKSALNYVYSLNNLFRNWLQERLRESFACNGDVTFGKSKQFELQCDVEPFELKEMRRLE
jgi:hypothetical protein